MSQNPQTVGSAVAKRKEAEATLGRMVTNMGPQLQRALPKHLDGDRMARIALTLIRQSELSKSTVKLSGCTPESFAGALLTSAALGLEPGVGGQSYLIPYGSECTLVIGYQGLVKLAWQHPLMLGMDAQAVYESDEFDYGYGLDAHLHHKPARGDRGAITNYYAWWKLTNGGRSFVVLTPDEVKELRKGKVGSSDAKIGDPMKWMERKTALRQALKTAPKSIMTTWGVEADERPGSELYVRQVPKQIGDDVQAVTTGETVTGPVSEGDPNHHWDNEDQK